jgi:membrane-associated protease RseP (regulator of RpoE activity)
MEDQIHGAGDGSRGQNVEMPARSLWPVVLAFGIAVAFAGFVTHFAATLIGLAIGLIAAFGWWRDVVPSEKHEPSPVDPARRPKPVLTEARTVIRLRVGEARHRVHIPEQIHPYSAGFKGGLVGGACMAILACLYGLVVQHSIWYPINLLAGVVLPSIGAETTEQLRAFDALAFGAAVVGHTVISLLMGLIYAVILPMFPKYAPLWAGILMPLFWSGLISTILGLVNPALNERISWPWFVVSQLSFGMVGGFVVARGTQIQTMQSWGMAERAFIKAPGVSRPEKEE